MSYLFDPPPIVSLAVAGESRRFPVHRIYCVGRNYAEHAREMGGNPDREPPFFFTKPADALVPAGTDCPYPPGTADLHHEIELVVGLSRGGAGIAPADALSHVYGYAVGLDLTRRDLQAEAKKGGRPWDTAKGFDLSAPCSDLVPASRIGHPTSGRIALAVNGATRQEGDLADLIWSIPEMIAFLSGLYTLRPGDLIFTGTPAGVGAVKRGDILEGSVAGIGEITTKIV